MNFRSSLPIFLIMISVMQVRSQDIEIGVLTDIFSVFATGDAPSATAATTAVTGALDNVAASATPLDYVSASAGQADPFSALAGTVSRQNQASGLGALDIVTGAYGSTGFYQSGVFGNLETSGSYLPSATPFPSLGVMSIYSPEWSTITSGFGYREQFNRMHKGIDIAMAVGDTVRVALPGIVERVAYQAEGYGHYIIVKHDNGLETRYAHLSATLVSAGQRVLSRQPIALSGNTGNSTGPHLHFETRYNGQAVDPTTVFNFNGSGNYQAANYGTPSLASSSPAIATGFNGTKTSLSGKSTYVVRQGDTPKKIADRAGISVYRFCQLNFIMENDKLKPGTMVKLR